MSNDNAIVGNTEIVLTDQMRAIYWNSPRGFCIGGAVLVVALVIFVAVAVLGEGMQSASGIIVGLVCLLFWPTLVVRAFRRLSIEQRLVSYEISRDQITIRDATGTANILPWKIVRRVVESRSGFALKLVPAGTRWIPKRAFAAEAMPHLHRLIESRMAERKAADSSTVG